MLLKLKIKGTIVSVGRKWYLEADFPDIAPDLSSVFRTVKAHPENGCSVYTVMEVTGLSESMVEAEFKFLKEQKLIYLKDSRWYPYFIPEPIEPHELGNYVDFLTRNELVALVKLFVQQTKWAFDSIESAQRLINSRTYPQPVTLEKRLRTTESTKEDFSWDVTSHLNEGVNLDFSTDFGNQFQGIEIDSNGVVHLDFGGFGA